MQKIEINKKISIFSIQYRDLFTTLDVRILSVPYWNPNWSWISMNCQDNVTALESLLLLIWYYGRYYASCIISLKNGRFQYKQDLWSLHCRWLPKYVFAMYVNYVRWLWHVFGGFFEAHKRAGRELLNANRHQIQMKIDKLVNVFESNVF